MEPKEQDHSAAIGPHSVDAQRPTKKKALSIAIRYNALFERSKDGQHLLKNAYKDLAIVREILSKFGYKDEDIVVLSDDSDDPCRLPTRDNILAAIKKLVSDVEEGDHVVFHFSGHGSQQPAREDTDEVDGQDELIWPCDIEFNGGSSPEKNYILDDTLKDELVDTLKPGVRLTAIFDSCHSGTGLDLYCEEIVQSPISEETSRNFVNSLFQNKQNTALTLRGKRRPRGTGTLHLNYDAQAEGDESKVDAYPHVNMAKHRKGPNDESPLITSWSACLDEQLEVESNNGGAFVNAMLKLLGGQRDTPPTNKDVLYGLTYILRDKINLSRDKWSKKLKEAKAQEKLDPDEISKCEERLEMLLEIKPKPVFSCMMDVEDRLKELFVL